MADNSVENNNLQLLRVNHSIKMTEAFETMFLDESLCDISICCGGEVVKAHRVILAASSSYFKQILSGINCQTQYPIIFVNGIQMPDLTSMLEFMYRGEVTIPQTQLPSLIKSAEVLGVSGLCQLDPNAQNISETQDKSRTSSPTDSTGGTTRRGRKRKKPIVKSDNEIGSDSETLLKKAEDICDETEDLDTNEVKAPTEKSEKLVKSKLRSWTQQIALKANHKESEESQPMSESETQSQQSVDESQTVTESTVSTQPKKNILKENWRHSRARKPPLKYSEYTLPKGFQDVKSTVDKKSEPLKESPDTETDETTNTSTTVMVRPPTPRLTRGRSRVHSNDDPKVINIKEEELDSVASTSSTPTTSGDTPNSSTLSLTPNTRSRRQTHSPSEGKLKDNESITPTSDKPTIKSEDDSSQGSTSQAVVRTKTPVKLQNSTPSSSSLFKWRPKDPQLTTTKFTEKVRSNANSKEELNYQYESIEVDGPPVYRCSYCMHCFRSKQNIIDHIKSVHIKSDERYICPICLKQFKWKTSLNNHLNQTHPHSRPTPLRHFDKTRKSLP